MIRSSSSSSYHHGPTHPLFLLEKKNHNKISFPHLWVHKQICQGRVFSIKKRGKKLYGSSKQKKRERESERDVSLLLLQKEDLRMQLGN